MNTVHIDLCIRCHRALLDGKMIKSNELAALIVCREMDVVDVTSTDIVCDWCRQGIGDEVADRMLQIKKGGT